MEVYALYKVSGCRKSRPDCTEAITDNQGSKLKPAMKYITCTGGLTSARLFHSEQ